MERSAAGDDLVPCPNCRSRDHLLIRWIPEIDYRVHERTNVGCSRCELWRSAKEDKWAFAQWNNWACDEWAKLGHEVPHARLYQLLVEEMHVEVAERAAAGAVAKYLKEEIASRCKWTVGDRFEALEWPHGLWSVRNVEAVYGINTGPFCILKARNVLPSGTLGDSMHEFWDFRAQMKPLSPFWRPRKWSQVVVGDACWVAEQLGVIAAVDREARQASITSAGQTLSVGRLSELLVPVHRVEADDA
jgi:hypothetical protein